LIFIRFRMLAASVKRDRAGHRGQGFRQPFRDLRPQLPAPTLCQPGVAEFVGCNAVEQFDGKARRDADVGDLSRPPLAGSGWSSHERVASSLTPLEQSARRHQPHPGRLPQGQARRREGRPDTAEHGGDVVRQV
jgi:hypothetical protein